MTTRSIRSYREASRYCGVPVTSLRDAVARGDVPAPTTGPDGRTVWDVGALDALRAARVGTAPAGSVVTPSAASAAVSSALVPPTTFGPITADFLLAASSAHADSGGEDENEDDVETHLPPFWMSGTDAGPSYPIGIPVIDPITYQVFYKPEPVTAVHAPGSVGAVVQQLQAQVAELQAQLATATTAWHHLRVASFAAEIAIEALMSGTLPPVAMAARDAAHAAAAALTDDELRREDGYPQAVARSAGMTAAQQVGAGIASAWQAQQARWPSPPPRERHDELSRARARRRSRAPRW